MAIMEWTNPDILWFLLLLPIFAVALFYQLRKKRKRVKEIWRENIQADRSYRYRAIQLLLILLGSAFILLALANPRKGDQPISREVEQAEIILAVDISRSMLAYDVQPNRLTIAKNICLELIEELAEVTGALAGAALAAPLVVSVHSVVSLDFTIAIIPGYHSTMFPPYFVAGALYSGFCMVLTIAIPLRAAFKLHDFITLRHFDNCAKVLLAAGHIVAYGYVLEVFFAWYSGEDAHRHMIMYRMFGEYAWTFWAMIGLNVGLLQLLWFRRVRNWSNSLNESSSRK